MADAIFILARDYARANDLIIPEGYIANIDHDLNKEDVIPYYRTEEYINSLKQRYDEITKLKDKDRALFDLSKELWAIQDESKFEDDNFIIGGRTEKERLESIRNYIDFLSTKIIMVLKRMIRLRMRTRLILSGLGIV